MSTLRQYLAATGAVHPKIDVDSEVLDELRAREAEVAQQFDEAAVGDAADPAHRWHSLDRLVNVALRGLTNTARTTGEQGEFAIHGAAGVVGFYDHAIGDGRSS
ncbi:hypothetical protein BJF84_10675 [Rhodococcus sp. CUA-806]|nr:hypothetical protein BJF84_24925 [Rhodococcus sp. CUA-806]OLT36461.1 hypothetical protein BJF84_10675 [Rhodococcus sp. CUA-806]